ncbi:MAG: hypothetical protein R3C11_18510 [Planctomycetaceae bacterium]
MRNGQPHIGNEWINLDTWAYNGLPLTAFDTTNNIFYQADQTGKSFPSFTLEECESVSY